MSVCVGCACRARIMISGIRVCSSGLSCAEEAMSFTSSPCSSPGHRKVAEDLCRLGLAESLALLVLLVA